MKKSMVILGVAAALVLSVTAQAQCCAAGKADALLEKALIVKFADEAGIDAYDMADFLSGYAEYASAMEGLEKVRAEEKAALEAAIAAGNSSDISKKMNDLMAADKAIFDARQEAVSQASALLSTANVAKLYLQVSDLDAQKAALRAELLGKKAPCAAAPATCAAPAAPAAPALSDNDVIMNGVKAFMEKLAKKDIDGALEGVSDDFEHNEFGDKEGLKDFLKQAVDMGYLDDVKVSTEDAEVKLDGDKATVYPIDLEGAFGSVTLEFTLAKVNGTWELVGMDASGI